MKSFLSRFGSLVLFVLSGFDRLRFCGESRLLNHAGGVSSFLYQQRIQRKVFGEYCKKLTHILRQESKALAARQGVPIQHLDSPKIQKDEVALELARAHGRSSGRIALITCQEAALTYCFRKNDQGLFEPRKESTRCNHHYHYFLHERRRHASARARARPRHHQQSSKTPPLPAQCHRETPCYRSGLRPRRPSGPAHQSRMSKFFARHEDFKTISMQRSALARSAQL